MTSTTSNPKSYFDIHTSGIGYIQRVREVQVKGGRKAMPFLLDIAILGIANRAGQGCN